jgi:hypothetical protein
MFAQYSVTDSFGDRNARLDSMLHIGIGKVVMSSTRVGRHTCDAAECRNAKLQ